MEGSLADFCDVVWQRTLDAASADALIKATSAVAVAPASVEDMIALVRLPRVLIEDAVGFAKQHADACLLSRTDLPSIAVPDPWDGKRKADLEARVRRSIGQVLRLAQKHWGFSKEQMAVSQCAAVTDLLGDLARQWEEGQRAYYKALQKCDAVAWPESPESPGVSGRQSGKKPHGKRGPIAEVALRELTETVEGWERIFAAGTDVKIGNLIGRKRGAVIRTTVWKKEIAPRLRMLKAERQARRPERDERRCDRYETD